MRLGLLASFVLVLATASNTTGGGSASAQPLGGTGLWSKAASLATGREEHTATLLPNGKVLVAGGTDGRGKVLASAELYDPVRNRWTSAGSMAATRIGHTATLLPSGKVLVAGGLVLPFPASQLTSAEIYDPRADRWSLTAPTGEHRLGHTATLLPDGRVFVAGGQSDSGTFLKSTEIYDPTQDRWISAAPMAAARFGHVATLTADGDLFVAGGLGEEPLNLAVTSAELYNPGTNLWVTVASMAAFHAADTATVLRSGNVLVVGAPGESRAEVYDQARNRWTQTGPSMNRYQHTATRLPNGRVLIVGGYGIESIGSVLIYDPLGVPPAPRMPPDPRAVAALLLTFLIVLASGTLSIPAVRLRAMEWRPRDRSEEWIT